MTVEKAYEIYSILSNGDYCVVGSKYSQIESVDILPDVMDLVSFYLSHKTKEGGNNEW